MSSTSSMVTAGVTVGTSEVDSLASVVCAMLTSVCRMSDAAALADDEMTSAEEVDAVLLIVVVVVSQHRVMKLLDDG